MPRNFGDREGSNLRRPPLAVVLVAVVVIALGETGGAAMSRLKPQIERYATARVAANPQTHGLSGSAEYDDEVRDRAVFAVEAGLSFFHTHAEELASSSSSRARSWRAWSPGAAPARRSTSHSPRAGCFPS